MVSEKQIEAAAKMLSRFIDLSGHTEDWVSYAVGAALTAAEQAEPNPAARSGAVKVDDSLLNALRLSGRVSFDEFKQTVLRALEPAEPEVMCVGCEGKPSLGNNPCAVCGKQAAEPATDAEPVELQPQEPNEKLKAMWADYEAVNQQKRPPESRLREALEGLLAPFSDDPCRIDHHGYCQAHFLELHCCVAKARSALAQEDGR